MKHDARWSQKVTERSHALDLEPGVFALREAREHGLVAKEQLLLVAHKLQQVPLAYVVLDRIYALPWEEQLVFLKELGTQLMDGIDLTSLNGTVAERLFRHRGKELKTIIDQEKAKKAG